MLAMIDLLLLRIPFKSKFVLQTKSHDDTGQYVDLIEICKFSGCARFIPVYTRNTKKLFKFGYSCSVYPCVYREHRKIDVRILCHFGLSLCIQGTPVVVSLSSSGIRFIPVYTGNTHTVRNIYDYVAVYPCVYREHLKFRYCIDPNVGLSLCIQGTPEV